MVGAGAGAATDDLYEGRDIDWANVGLNALAGLFLGGLVGGAASRVPRGTGGTLFARPGSHVEGIRSRLSTASSLSEVLRGNAPSKSSRKLYLQQILKSFCRPNVHPYHYLPDGDDDDERNRGYELLPIRL
jgi:hypothetical protein